MKRIYVGPDIHAKSRCRGVNREHFLCSSLDANVQVQRAPGIRGLGPFPTIHIRIECSSFRATKRQSVTEGGRTGGRRLSPGNVSRSALRGVITRLTLSLSLYLRIDDDKEVQCTLLDALLQKQMTSSVVGVRCGNQSNLTYTRVAL